MALPTSLASLSSTRSSFISYHSDQCLIIPAPAATRKQDIAVAPRIVNTACSSHSTGTDEVDGAVTSRRAGLMAASVAGLALVLQGGGNSTAHAAMQKVEGTRRDTQDAVTRGLREPSQLGTGKGNSMKEAGRLNTQASGGTVLGAPRFEEPGGAYRSPQSQTEKSFDKRSSPAGILQQRQEGS